MPDRADKRRSPRRAKPEVEAVRPKVGSEQSFKSEIAQGRRLNSEKKTTSGGRSTAATSRSHSCLNGLTTGRLSALGKLDGVLLVP